MVICVTVAYGNLTLSQNDGYPPSGI